MGIKLIAVDIDGTLLNSNNELDVQVKKAIIGMMKKNKQVVLCTGKSCEEIKEIQEKLGLVTLDNFVIAQNGLVIENALTNQLIKENTISYSDFLEISDILDQLALHYHLRTNQGIVTPNQEVDKYTKYDSLLSNEAIQIVSKENLMDQQIYKIMIVGEPEYLEEKIPQIPLAILNHFACNEEHFCFKELSNKEANKGAALSYLCQYLYIKQDEVLAIGDGYNDISMFEYAGTSVAMGNASPRVQHQATFVTDSNDQQGVAKAIHSWA